MESKIEGKLILFRDRKYSCQFDPYTQNRPYEEFPMRGFSSETDLRQVLQEMEIDQTQIDNALAEVGSKPRCVIQHVVLSVDQLIHFGLIRIRDDALPSH